ncbi:hypothetical protein GF325_06190 [Candidatus Bathyarchaeota archaeon]|nr:hypothetical protein [Candidatus Bathyarchaeota archaeon]
MSMKFVRRGKKRLLKEEWKEAEEEFVKAVETNDISAKGWYYLGICRDKQDDPDGAMFSFKKAMSAAKMQDPDDVEVIRNSLFALAEIQIKSQQFIAAMGYLRRINKMDFKDNELRGRVWGQLGEIYEKLNKLEYSLFCYRQAQKMGNRKYRKQISKFERDGYKPDDPEDKNSPNILKRKADILFNQQKFEDAIKAYQQTIEMNNNTKVLRDSDHADVVMKIAYAYINLQDFNSARHYLMEAKRLYAKAKMEDELKVIDSTLNKINSLMAV